MPDPKKRHRRHRRAQDAAHPRVSLGEPARAKSDTLAAHEPRALGPFSYFLFLARQIVTECYARCTAAIAQGVIQYTAREGAEGGGILTSGLDYNESPSLESGGSAAIISPLGFFILHHLVGIYAVCARCILYYGLTPRTGGLFACESNETKVGYSACGTRRCHAPAAARTFTDVGVPPTPCDKSPAACRFCRLVEGRKEAGLTCTPGLFFLRG